jgi:hypothetical protein
MSSVGILATRCPQPGDVPTGDPCHPCGPKKLPPQPPATGVWSTSGGWYAVITEIPNPAVGGAGEIAAVMGGGGATVSIPTSIQDTGEWWSAPLWIVDERNVLYDTAYGYGGGRIGQYGSIESASEAAATVLANSRPIVTYSVIVAVGPGTGHPPGL